MVKPEYEENPPEGWDYDDMSRFADAVDVKREWLDSSAAVRYVGYRVSLGKLIETTAEASAIIRDAEAGVIALSPASCQFQPRAVRVSYLSGLMWLSENVEDVVVRLAHSRLPDSPCGCNFLKAMWERDTHIPQVLTAERENCPWGMSDGAWTAWMFARSSVQHRARALLRGV